MLLDVDALPQPGGVDTIVDQMISVASVSTRSTDLIGWYKTGSVFGMLFTEISFEKHGSISQLLRAKIVQSLRDELGVQIASRIQLAVHAFPAALDRDGLTAVAELIA